MQVRLKEETLESLAGKLDEFGQVLTDEERALLLTIFRLGANALEQIGTKVGRDTETGARPIVAATRMATTTPALSNSIREAFHPALARGLRDINVAAGGVEIGVKWSA